MESIVNFIKKPVFIITLVAVLGFVFIGVLVNNKRAEEAAKPRGTYEVKYWGVEDAKVVITEYGDFQCEACLAFYMNTEKVLREEYEDKIRFEYKYLNLKGHSNSQIAAEASEAAHAQGKFWEFHDMLFERQEREANGWNIDRMVAYAQELNLDTERFRKELTEDYYAKAVEVPAKEGADKGYNATPTVEINGKKIDRPTIQILEAEIERLLAENQ